MIPYFEALPELRRTLIGLFSQTYPESLVDITVVDDGSAQPLLERDVSDIGKVTIVRQQDQGFRLAAARNRGALASANDVLVFLDADMIPDPLWLESHMRWHHTTSRAVVVGFRDHIDSGWLTEELIHATTSGGGLSAHAGDHRVERPEWIEFHMTRTQELTSADDDLFRVITGGNLSVGRQFFDELGRWDESFIRWGGEDTELGWRAWVRGGLFIPDRDAHCWHQGLGTSPDEFETAEQAQQIKKLAHLIPHPAIRTPTPGRTWLRPLIVAHVDSGAASDKKATTEALLKYRDIAVVLSSHGDNGLAEDFGPDPRVWLDSSTDKGDFSPLFLTVPGGVLPSPELIDELAAKALAVGQAKTPDGLDMISARHKNQGLLDVTTVKVASRSWTPPTTLARVVQRMRRIRNLNDVRSAARWLFAAAKRRRSSPHLQPTEGHQLSPSPWAFVLAPETPTLPGTADPKARIDLEVTAESGSGEHPTLILENRTDRALLEFPPIQPEAALRVIQGSREPETDLERLLAGRRPHTTPPGPATSAAMSLFEPLPSGHRLEHLRRLVLSEHLADHRLHQIRTAAGLPTNLPRVSVILCTRRTNRAVAVVQAMLSQSYRHMELVVACHGSDSAPIEEIAAESELGVKVLRVDGAALFGTALSIASRETTGDLIAKIDDDDLYSSTHVEDLATAWLISRADIVGKAAEFVRFEDSGQTIHRFTRGAYTSSHTLAGGALAITRSAYDSCGGWRQIQRHVDKALIEDVTTVGGRTFRTHGFGYILVRHGDHTWKADRQRFIDQAERTWADTPEWILDPRLVH